MEKCIKCGSGAINTTFKKSLISDTERLDKKCIECGFSYTQKCKDSL